MRAHESEYSVRDLCRAFGISRSHYYSYREGPPGPRARQEEELLEQIRRIDRAHKGCYGSPRITQKLREEGWRCGRGRVARLMRENGIRARAPKRFVPCTTDSNHGGPIAPNRLAQLQSLERLDQVWTSDITYIRLPNRWAYLALVMDLFSRRILGWSLQEHMRAGLVMEALQRAFLVRHPPAGMLHHSDQGVQYASFKYQSLLAEHHILPSMSRRGNCYDNAAMESFIGTLKSELHAPRGFPSAPQARTALFEYIEVFYNRKRLHSSLGYRSPVAFEEALN